MKRAVYCFFLIIIAIMIFGACKSNCKTNVSASDYHDSITVYGNEHLILATIVPLEEQAENKTRVEEVQKWLSQQISEDVVVVEGFSFKREPYTTAMVYYLAGVTTPLHEKMAKEFADLYDASLAFIFQGRKQVYGGENDSLFALIVDSVQADVSFVLSPEFKKLNDARSEAIAKNAELISAQNRKRVAVILGKEHLDWFETHGYNVKYAP